MVKLKRLKTLTKKKR